ncbi:hypothetical protein [Microbispora sp. GKU 823]|uniref:hypothetical protein n=1 Tax=Microbispora sp. GKU 823 TaxID=1652100 RepID=UPI0009A267C1|nr:hypothetical protein [Microbispora sp. GKU 823]OPG08988.1 hypothetical protein B1L11_27060 [Microbispora sp. GKU 823]
MLLIAHPDGGDVFASGGYSDEFSAGLQGGEDTLVVEAGVQVGGAEAVARAVGEQVDHYVVSRVEEQCREGFGVVGMAEDVDGVDTLVVMGAQLAQSRPVDRPGRGVPSR